MNLKWEQWFLAQCHRKDAVGPLARLWVEHSRANPTINCETWLEDLSNDPKWEIYQTKILSKPEDILGFLQGFNKT